MSPVKFGCLWESGFTGQTGWLSWQGGDRNLPLFINAGSLGFPLSNMVSTWTPTWKGSKVPHTRRQVLFGKSFSLLKLQASAFHSDSPMDLVVFRDPSVQKFISKLKAHPHQKESIFRLLWNVVVDSSSSQKRAHCFLGTRWEAGNDHRRKCL